MSETARRSILILDDDSWHLSWISDLAEGRGFDCIFVSTYDEAIDAFSQHRPAVAVVDIRIGDVDEPREGATLVAADASWVGLRFLRFVRVTNADSKTPLFVYTGLDREDLQRIVENTFSSRFFTKFNASLFRLALDGELARAAKR